MDQRYSVEGKTNPSMINVGVALIFFNLITYLVGHRASMFDVADSEASVSEFFVGLFYLVIQVVCTVWSVKVAGQLNRSQAFWGIITFIFTPIALVVLGSKDVFMEPEFAAVYSKHKSDYFLETIKLKKDYERDELTADEYRAKLALAEEKHTTSLNAEMQKMEAVLERKHEFEVIAKVEGDGTPIVVTDKCPACGMTLSQTDDVCPDCGLQLR